MGIKFTEKVTRVQEHFTVLFAMLKYFMKSPCLCKIRLLSLLLISGFGKFSNEIYWEAL